MAAEGRFPGTLLFGLLLLAGSVGGVAWWLHRPGPEPAPADPAPESLDVVCTGRVDAAGMVIPLDPASAGRVAKVSVGEGDAVTKGQEVLRLEDDSLQARQAQAVAAVDAARIELEAATHEAERVPGQLAAREQLLAASAARVAAARSLVQQRREQQSLAPLTRAEQEGMDARIRELEALEAAERGQLEDLKKADPELRVRLARAKLKAAEADHRLAEKAVKECSVTAPADGTILRLQVAVGALIGPGSPVPPVVFAPAGPLVVRAEVDQEFLGRVSVGMAAAVQDENRPDGPTWTGKVRSVAGWVAMRRTLVLDPGELNDVRTVECAIDLDPPAAGLWIGQRMRVRIVRGK